MLFQIIYYLRRRLASGEGIVSLGVRLSRCHAVWVSAALVSTAKVTRSLSLAVFRESSSQMLTQLHEDTSYIMAYAVVTANDCVALFYFPFFLFYVSLYYYIMCLCSTRF